MCDNAVPVMCVCVVCVCVLFGRCLSLKKRKKKHPDDDELSDEEKSKAKLDELEDWDILCMYRCSPFAGDRTLDVNKHTPLLLPGCLVVQPLSNKPHTPEFTVVTKHCGVGVRCGMAVVRFKNWQTAR